MCAGSGEYRTVQGRNLTRAFFRWSDPRKLKQKRVRGGIRVGESAAALRRHRYAKRQGAI
jgi:hypothetical protein